MNKVYTLIVVHDTSSFSGTLHDACVTSQALIGTIWKGRRVLVMDGAGKIVAEVEKDAAVYKVDTVQTA
jgi:hypothetical protein